MKHTALMVVFTMGVMSAASKTPAQKPRFEVASIKPNRSGNSYLTSNGFQACSYVAHNATLKTMVAFAYRLPGGQVLPLDRVIGGPSWVETDHFDVESKRRSEADSISLDQVLLMVQSFLEERFQLRTHWSTQDLPVYDLAVAKDGLKLKSQRIKRSYRHRQVIQSSIVPGRLTVHCLFQRRLPARVAGQSHVVP